MADAGRILIIPRGDYNANSTYDKLDLVKYKGTSWLAKKNATGVEPSEGEYWQNMFDFTTVDNLTTTAEGFALDARQGKILNDAIALLGADIVFQTFGKSNTLIASQHIMPNGFKDILTVYGRNIFVFCDTGLADLPSQNYFGVIIIGYGQVNTCIAIRADDGAIFTRVYYSDNSYDTGWLDGRREITSIDAITDEKREGLNVHSTFVNIASDIGTYEYDLAGIVPNDVLVAWIDSSNSFFYVGAGISCPVGYYNGNNYFSCYLNGFNKVMIYNNVSIGNLNLSIKYIK